MGSSSPLETTIWKKRHETLLWDKICQQLRQNSIKIRQAHSKTIRNQGPKKKKKKKAGVRKKEKGLVEGDGVATDPIQQEGSATN